MKVVIQGKKAKLTPTGGSIRDKQTLRTYSEVVVPLKYINRYEDADSVTYETIPVDTLPEDVRQCFDKVLQLIVTLATSYGAMDALRSLEQVNIASLFALADQFHVDDKDLQNLIIQVVMLKTDIEARLPRSWYDLWNGNLKPYILEALKG